MFDGGKKFDSWFCRLLFKLILVILTKYFDKIKLYCPFFYIYFWNKDELDGYVLHNNYSNFK